MLEQSPKILTSEELAPHLERGVLPHTESGPVLQEHALYGVVPGRAVAEAPHHVPPVLLPPKHRAGGGQHQVRVDLRRPLGESAPVPSLCFQATSLSVIVRIEGSAVSSSPRLPSLQPHTLSI